jgi:hypothetical protein
MSDTERDQLEAERELINDLIAGLDEQIWQLNWWIKNGHRPLEDFPEALNPQRKRNT